MSLYTVKPSEIRGLTPDARKRLQGWIDRVNALPKAPPLAGVDVTTDLFGGTQEIRRPKPCVLCVGDHIFERGYTGVDPYTGKDTIAAAWERQGWDVQTAKPDRLRVSWQGGEYVSGHFTEQADRDRIVRALTKGPRAKAAPVVAHLPAWISIAPADPFASVPQRPTDSGEGTRIVKAPRAKPSIFQRGPLVPWREPQSA